VSGTDLASTDPRTGEVRTAQPETPAGAVDAVCAGAGDLFQERLSSWDAPDSGTSEPSRLLRFLADQLDRNRDELIAVLDRETALGSARLAGEHARTVFQLRAFADAAGTDRVLQPIVDTADPGRVPPRSDQRRINVPIGPVVVFAASNFPLAFGILGGDTASALAARCPVVVKGHPAQPFAGALIEKIIADALAAADIDPRWLQVVHGGSVDVGRRLVGHPAIAAVGFTGSTAGGMALVRVAAERRIPIPVYAEMGSVNPTFVGRHAAVERADDIGGGWAGTLAASAGQLCTQPGLLIVPEDAADGIVSAARAALSQADIIPMLAPRLAETFAAGVERAASVPGVRMQRLAQPDSSGCAVPAAIGEVDADTVLAAPELLEEIFGPAGLVVRCPVARMPDLARAIDGSLTAAIFADPGDTEWARGLIPILRTRVGRLTCNTWPTGVSVGWATVHGGPWPATSVPHGTSVGLTAAWRFLRPVAFDGFPLDLLPAALRTPGE